MKKSVNIGKKEIKELFVTLPKTKGMPLPEVPGIIISINGITTGITLDHNQVYAHWENSKLKNSELLHIDGHADMCSGVYSRSENPEKSAPYWSMMDIAGFIVPAIHYRIVSSVYWLNPHCIEKKRLRDMGCVEKNKRLSIDTFLEKQGLPPFTIRAIGPEGKINNEGEIIECIKLDVNKPFVLDIDLDAFCCHKQVNNMPSDYKGIAGYVGRLSETIYFLKNLKRKPNLITITYSAGQQYAYNPHNGYRGVSDWCPKEHRRDVMERTIEELKEIY
jgi:hypothetical protein